MYALHLGIKNMGHTVRIEDELLGKVVIFGKHSEPEVISLETAGGMNFAAFVEPDSFRLWGERITPEMNLWPAHVIVKTNELPTLREVHWIREALIEHVLLGQMMDYALLTNGENYSQAVKVYLWHSQQSGLPTELEVS